MKRLLKRALVFTVVVAVIATIGVAALANPGQNPNMRPYGPEVTNGGLTITVTGGGNNLVIRAIYNGVTQDVPRTGQGTWSQVSTITFAQFNTIFTVTINVQGNSLRGFTVTDKYVCVDVWCQNECADCACGRNYGCGNDTCRFNRDRVDPCLPCDCNDEPEPPIFNAVSVCLPSCYVVVSDVVNSDYDDESYGYEVSYCGVDYDVVVN